jgi:aminoglycoside phosphotransferase (APT) family kinase protein
VELTGDQRAALADALGPGTGITALRSLSAGASRLSWSLDAVVAGEPRELVLQRQRVPGQGNCDVGTEVRLLRAAAACGVPVPEVVAHDPVGTGVGGGFVVTTRVEGATLARVIQRDDAYAAARATFAADCGRILAAIHAVPVPDVAPLDGTDRLDRLAATMDSLTVRRPAFEYALRRLRSSRPPARPVALVHGDFRLGNLVMGPDGVRAVLDWELAHLGDPVEDLGWLSARPWRFGGPAPVGGIGDADALLAAYRSHGGAAVPPAELRWWQVYGALQWGVYCLLQAQVHLSGYFPSVELAVVGRRAAEMEYEVLVALP